jgi:hypothetical protein
MVEGTFLLEPVDGGTRLTARLVYETPAWIFGKFLDKVLIEKEMTGIYAEGLQKLRQILEA